MEVWKVCFLFSALNSVILASEDAIETRITSDSTQILSRKRRFFLPRTNAWVLQYAFDTLVTNKNLKHLHINMV